MMFLLRAIICHNYNWKAGPERNRADCGPVVETNMKKIEHEMPQEYQNSLAALVNLIEIRDTSAEALRLLPEAENSPQLRAALADLTNKIEVFESALAEEYESHQLYKKAEVKSEISLKKLDDRTKRAFIYVKHLLPEKIEEFLAVAFKDKSPEAIEEFYDEIAIIESTELDSIIAKMKR
jgi:hypothetical protein